MFVSCGEMFRRLLFIAVRVPISEYVFHSNGKPIPTFEQLQTELRVYRTQRFNQDSARKMEDLENDVSTLEIERDNLKSRLERAEQQMQVEAGSIKVKRALEIAAMTAETAASLNDLLSSLRIEVMAAEGEFEQYAHNIPRASFELIRQSMKDAAAHCDEARELLRKLREVAE